MNSVVKSLRWKSAAGLFDRTALRQRLQERPPWQWHAAAQMTGAGLAEARRAFANQHVALVVEPRAGPLGRTFAAGPTARLRAAFLPAVKLVAVTSTETQREIDAGAQSERGHDDA